MLGYSGCTDVDDALSVRFLGDDIELGVHIADVSHFVHQVREPPFAILESAFLSQAQELLEAHVIPLFASFSLSTT